MIELRWVKRTVYSNAAVRVVDSADKEMYMELQYRYSVNGLDDTGKHQVFWTDWRDVEIGELNDLNR